jgi:hypothetical protein
MATRTIIYFDIRARAEPIRLIEADDWRMVVTEGSHRQ